MIEQQGSRAVEQQKSGVRAQKFFCYLLFALYYSLSPIPCISAAEVLQEITVKEGDTLWGVSNHYLKDSKRWSDILRHNPQLSSDPNVILPGMKIKVPILLIKEHLRAAYLVYILEDVRYRRRKEADWRRALLNMELYEEDGIRTLEKSQANVKFPSGEILKLYENSLLIVRPEKPREEAELLSGQVRASKTKILTADTVVNPKIIAKTDAPDFKTKIKEDKTTLVEVYKGIIDVTAQGKTVTVKEGFGTEVKFKMAPGSPIKLPEMPDFAVDLKETRVLSAKERKFELAVETPETTPKALKKDAEAPAKEKPSTKIIGGTVKKYRLQISTTASFSNIVLDEVKDIKGRVSIDYADLKLNDGLYFWRIAYMDELGFEGRFSQPSSFVIDTIPPEIKLISPVDGGEYDTDFIYVEGITEPNTNLLVNGVPTNIEDNGQFLYAILVKDKDGVVKIKVEATDSAGNLTVVERSVLKVRKGKARRTDISGSQEKPKKQPASTTMAIAAATIFVILGVIWIIAGL